MGKYPEQFPDALGLHKLKSPLGDFKLTTTAHGEQVSCPLTGTLYNNKYTDKSDADIQEVPLKCSLNRSKKLWVKDDADILIHHLRHTNYVNSNTNERRLGFQDQATAPDHNHKTGAGARST